MDVLYVFGMSAFITVFGVVGMILNDRDKERERQRAAWLAKADSYK